MDVDATDLVITEVMTQAASELLGEPTPDQTFLNFLFLQGYTHTAPGTWYKEYDGVREWIYHRAQGQFDCVRAYRPQIQQVAINLRPFSFDGEI